MPTDIRNFFKVTGTTGKNKKPNNSNSNNNNNDNKTASSKPARASALATVNPPNDNSQARRMSPRRRANKEDNNKNEDDRVEISASDYFRKATASASASSSKINNNSNKKMNDASTKKRSTPQKDDHDGEERTNEKDNPQPKTTTHNKRPKTTSAAADVTYDTAAASPKTTKETSIPKKSPTETVEFLQDDDDDDDAFLQVVEQVENQQQKQQQKPSQSETTSSQPRRTSPRRMKAATSSPPGLSVSSSSTATTKATPQKSQSSSNKTTTPTPAKTTKAKTTTTPTPAKGTATATPLKPSLCLPDFDMNQPAAVHHTPLSGYTFVVTGVLPESSSSSSSLLSRDDVTEWIKQLGGRVTTAVSSKTDYLVILGPTLEDGRPSTEGSKYKKATSINNSSSSKTKGGSVHLVEGKEQLFGLLQQYCDLVVDAKQEKEDDDKATETKKETKPETNPDSSSSEDEPEPPAAAAPPPPPAMVPTKRTNPYAKKIANPYAKKPKMMAPPTASAFMSNSAAAATNKPTPKNKDQEKKSSSSSLHSLWVDRYKPKTSQEILGNQESVRKLKAWLARWEERFNKDDLVGKSFSHPQGPWKAALLSGPPGIGKTTTASLVAREEGRELLEFNASDVRSKKALHDTMGDITGSRSIQFSKKSAGGTDNSGKSPRCFKKRCIIMDEVDGMGAGDRSGISELIQMIKNSRVPIICICNDRQSQKLKSLIPYCMDLKYRRPIKSVVAQRAVQVAAKEGFTVEYNAAEAIVESCGNDVRQVLNALQMWASSASKENKSSSVMTYRNLKEREKSINKDEILRVSLFDAVRLMLEGRKGLAGNTDPHVNLSHFFHRNDAFFVDYSFTGLLVQQNYLKVMQGQFNAEKRNSHGKNNNNAVNGGDTALERMYKAAESMSDFAHGEHLLRTDQNWSILPLLGSLAVKTGYHAGGETGGILPGFPEFTTWLGRNSTKQKRQRLISELNHHMNYKISGGNTELRLSYLPTLRGRFVSLLTTNSTTTNTDEDGVEAAIQFMDEYGLDRDDVLEKMDEFRLDTSASNKPFAQLLDSKKRAAFTRTYNSGTHKSQALVAEQGKTGTAKRGKGSASRDTTNVLDPDTIDDDGGNNDDDDDNDDEEVDASKIAALFKKKGGGGRKTTANPAAKKGAKKKAATTTTTKGRKKK